MATPTKREQIEELAHDIGEFEKEFEGKAMSGEDREKLNKMNKDLTNLVSDVQAVATASGTVDVAKALLGDMASSSDNGDESDEIVNGVVTPKSGMTLGEAFVKSPAYKGFIDRYASAAGTIPHSVKGIQSDTFETGSFKDLVTGASETSGGAAVRDDRYGPITDLVGEREIRVTDLVTRGTTSSDTVEYVRVTGKTNNASPTVEASATGGTSGTKPESAMTLEVVSTSVGTVAHWIPITKRAAGDAPQVRTLIDNFLRYGLEEEKEDQILTGDGTGENFTGILNTPGINTVGSAGTDIDAIVDAIREVRLDKRRPTAVVLHPNDWYSTGFLLAKDAQNRYLVGDPRASLDQLNQLWGLQVVVTEAMTENTALVGDFRQAVLWDRQQSSISVSDSHSDFFIRNLLAILAEERYAFGVLDPEAFCSVTGV